ncbi:MAG: response regulator transcription factor [Gammaproteobacteria bacterium]|jgi:DNA-binding response OmpR family regulator|nr:response regulator transcription factor [Gammaproteobacteria bacterium]MBT3724875.1 response regulator transcription factor [Gammaproteobacteria bacterium]MBT4077702.1 response regulator transcription factor [Gammaproteobacteria bacterium]MBT4192949.1 response regulator transcription factor [Gammaproteobacteria bacterium]MBT4450898.1 response regulator transcription factor [Gammaproteobacteria bacterium]
MQNKKIILIEDNKDISQLVKLHLNDIGLTVDVFMDGAEGWKSIQQNPYDLIILDIMLPGMDGLEILKKIRQSIKAYCPILMLTSRSSEMDRVLGLELGADDYLTKPFSLMELVARVKALLRRQDAMKASEPQHEKLSFSGLTINTQTREVLKQKEKLELTAKEFDLLLHFARHPGQVFGRMQLLDKVWGYGHEGYEHTVNSHINRLRGKLETDPASPEFIKTVWGVGYQFNATVESE